MRPLTILVLALACLCACSKSSSPVSQAAPSKPADAVQQKLIQYAGTSAADCGRFDTHVTADQFKKASDCAQQASQSKHPFYVAYDMPGMTVGVAGNTDGKLFTVQSQGSGPSATVTSADCPSQLRVAASGRVTCYAPGDMGSMGAGHAAVPPGMPNPHAMPKESTK